LLLSPPFRDRPDLLCLPTRRSSDLPATVGRLSATPPGARALRRRGALRRCRRGGRRSGPRRPGSRLLLRLGLRLRLELRPSTGAPARLPAHLRLQLDLAAKERHVADAVLVAAAEGPEERAPVEAGPPGVAVSLPPAEARADHPDLALLPVHPAEERA